MDEHHPILEQLKKHVKQLQKNAETNGTYVSTGALRRVLRSLDVMTQEFGIDERFEIVEFLYHKGAWTCHLCATHLLNSSLSEISEAHLPTIQKFVHSFDSWGAVDDFGTSVLPKLLQKFPQPIMEMIEGWNRSPNMWERRLSMVAFTRNLGESGLYTEPCLRMAENLLQDPEDLVQKAVGWALKDNMRGSKERVLTYVKDLRKRGISSVITLYAIRDLNGKEREEVLALKPHKPKRKKDQ